MMEPDGAPRPAVAATDGASRLLAAPPGDPQQPAAGSFTIAEAAGLLGVGERTLREWARAGKIPTLPAIPGERGARIAVATVEELRQARPLAWDGSGLVDGGGAPRPAAEPDGGERRLAAPPGGDRRQLAAEDGASQPLAAVAGAELVAAVGRERDHLAGEVEFLRRQLEAARQSEAELRVLLGHQAAALRQLTERPALAAPIEGEAAPIAPETAPPAGRSRRWWRLWGSG